MKLAKCVTMLSLAFLLVNSAQAKSGLFYNVPFENVSIPAGSKIYVNYAFNSHKQTLVCKSDSLVLSSAEWQYKDIFYKAMIENLILKDDSRFAGNWADPSGKITMVNEYGPDDLIVSCQYQIMN